MAENAVQLKEKKWDFYSVGDQNTQTTYRKQIEDVKLYLI